MAIRKGEGMKEAELIAAAREGDKHAFGELRAMHLRHVRLVGRAILRTDDLDDFIQDVFVDAWKGLKGFRGDATFRTWITSIARRRALAVIKQRKTKCRSLEVSDNQAPCAWAADQSAEYIESRMVLAQLVGGLSPSTRNLIELRLEGFSDREISSKTNLTLRQVRGRLQRTVDFMRKMQRAPEQIGLAAPLISDTAFPQEAVARMGVASKKKRSRVTRAAVDRPLSTAAEPDLDQGVTPDVVDSWREFRQDLTPGADLFEQLVAEAKQLEYLAEIERRQEFEDEICREAESRVHDAVIRKLTELGIGLKYEEQAFCRVVKALSADATWPQGCARLQELPAGIHSRKVRLFYLDAAVQDLLRQVISELTPLDSASGGAAEGAK
jgi:RNA polymerase sigma-70 factor, ECF subfamily